MTPGMVASNTNCMHHTLYSSVFMLTFMKLSSILSLVTRKFNIKRWDGPLTIIQQSVWSQRLHRPDSKAHTEQSRSVLNLRGEQVQRP